MQFNGRLIAVGVIVVLAVALIFGYIQTPAPIETFTPDGNHLGDVQIGTTWYSIFQIIFGSAIDMAWVSTTSVLQFLIFPFVAIVVVMYGIFSEISLFARARWINPVLALIIALVAASTGILVRIMRGYLMLAGGLGILLFGFVLVMGVVVWFVGRMRGFGYNVTGALKTATDNTATRTYVNAICSQGNEFVNRYQGDPAKAGKVIKVNQLIQQAQEQLNKGQYNTAQGTCTKITNEMRN